MQCYGESMVYFKKGSETWGSPLNWVTILTDEELNDPSSHFTVFPNPATDFTDIELVTSTMNSRFHINVIDIRGETVQKHVLQRGEQSLRISTAELSRGIYFLQLLQGGSAIATKKLVIQ